MIGKMRDKILIKAPIDIPQSGAGAISSYQTIINDWTQIMPYSSRRVEENGQINLNDGFSFHIRDRKSVVIDKTMLVEYNGKDYTINSIDPVKNRHRWLIIRAITNGQPVEIPVS